MKKLVCIFLLVCMAATLAVATSAADATVTGATEAPDWLITEINPNQQGDGTGGWSDAKDCMEYIELYNNTDRVLNIYDYAMFYNGVKRTAANWEMVVYEYTPFLPGNFLDGWGADDWTDTELGFCGMENVPVNPDTCTVAPGECIVVWTRFREAYYNLWNNGKGMSIADFRSFWQIPDSVQVICWDGNNKTGDTTGGHVKNFTPKNTECGTYGVCHKSDVLHQAANTGTTAAEHYKVNFLECPELICWATVDFDQIMTSSIANMSFNFTPDAQKLGAGEYDYIYDSRRELLVEFNTEATPGTLSTFQKLVMGKPLEAGDKLDLTGTDIYVPYVLDSKFQGMNINGTLYTKSDVFTASAAGVATFEYVYSNGNDTTPAPVETTTAASEETTPAPAETTTAAPEETTPAPVETTPADTTPAPVEEKGGCGSAVALGALVCMLPAAAIFCKKKH